MNFLGEAGKSETLLFIPPSLPNCGGASVAKRTFGSFSSGILKLLAYESIPDSTGDDPSKLLSSSSICMF